MKKNINQTRRFHLSRLPGLWKVLPALFLVLFAGSCADTVDTIRYENPPSLVDVKRELVVFVEDVDKSPLVNFDIVIEGPVSANVTGISESSFTLEELASGTYTITLIKEGFLQSSISREILVPDDVSSSFSVEVTIRLKEVEPPVVVDNDADTSVDVAPSSASTSEGQTTTIDIPANSFPEELANEEGDIEISVTRSTPSDVIETSDGVVQDIFTFDFPAVEETYPITFNQPIGISIPVNLPASILESINAVGELRYKIVSPGSGGLMQSMQEEAAFINPANLVNGIYTDSISVLPSAVIELIPNLDLNIITPPTPISPIVVASAGCGEDIETTYNWTSGLPDDSFVFLFTSSVPEQKQSSVNIEVEGVPNLKLTARVIRYQFTAELEYIDTNGARTVIESVNFLDTSAEVTLSSTNCHNSGGG